MPHASHPLALVRALLRTEMCNAVAVWGVILELARKLLAAGKARDAQAVPDTIAVAADIEEAVVALRILLPNSGL